MISIMPLIPTLVVECIKATIPMFRKKVKQSNVVESERRIKELRDKLASVREKEKNGGI